MFLVDDDRKERSKKIRSLIDKDPSLALISAVADLEWTIRRCILALAKSPTRAIREKILKEATFKEYTGIWNREVYPRVHTRLKDVMGDFTFKENQVFPLYNRIIHGELYEFGFIKFEYGREEIEQVLSASENLTRFAEKQNEPIYNRQIIRHKAR